MRLLIFCLILASVPVFGGSGFELWLEGGQTSNRVKFPGFGKHESATARLSSVRGLWFFPWGGREIGVSFGTSSPVGDGVVYGPVADLGITYTQSMESRYQPSWFIGLHYRGYIAQVKTTFTYSLDVRNSDTWVSADNYNSYRIIGSSIAATWELVPSVQATWNLFKRFNAGARLAYRFQLTSKDAEAHWFYEKQNHPEFSIVAGWKFGGL